MTAHWAHDAMVGFDLETTGVDVENDRIVTACVMTVQDGPTRTRSWLADPGIEIPPGTTAVHGVTTERARAEGRPAPEVIEEIVTALEDEAANAVPIVVMNAPFDLTLLDREARRHGITPLCERVDNPYVVDPLVIDKITDRYRSGKRTLSVLAGLYGVPLADAHDAVADCAAAVRIAWKMARRYREEVPSSLDELMPWQAAGHAVWAKGFEAYLRSKGSKEIVSRDWPIKPFPGEAVAA